MDLRDLLTRMETEMGHKTEKPISLMRDNLPALFEGLQNLLSEIALLASASCIGLHQIFCNNVAS